MPDLLPHQERAQDAFRSFARQEISPRANLFDQEEGIPRLYLRMLAAHGYVGSLLPSEWGGRALDTVSYGLLHKEIAQSSGSVASLLTVHDMTSHALLRWGNAELKKSWLPLLATGERMAAFAVSEAEAGSDVKAVSLTAKRRNDSVVLTGKKKWITGGQIADVFLVLGRCDGKPTTFFVERSRPGISVEPISGMLGLRASMLGTVIFDNCEIPIENMVGRMNFGETVVQTALDLGRLNVAWDSLGIIEGCMEASIDYADNRKQFGVPLSQHQLVSQMITEMVTGFEAARLLCIRASRSREDNDPQSTLMTLTAKYFASRTAARAASDAVQIHGAAGCSSEYPVARYLRDSKIMEIIEGSSQIQQLLISKLVPRQKQRKYMEESA
jgi:alkylation response protein AidB-like acyl-CoA dehydrogenase